MIIRVPYVTWLLHQIGRDDPIGDVAKDVTFDVHVGLIKQTWSWRKIFRSIRPRSDRVCLQAVAETIFEWFKNPVIQCIYPPESPGVYCVSYAALPHLVKVGRSSNIAKRLKSLETGAPGGVVLRAILSADPDDESAFHSRFERHHFDGEWFHADLLNELQ